MLNKIINKILSLKPYIFGSSEEAFLLQKSKRHVVLFCYSKV